MTTVVGTFNVPSFADPLIQVTDEIPLSEENDGVDGSAIHINVKPGEGTLIFFSLDTPVPITSKALVRAMVYVNNPDVQLFVGGIDCDESGNITNFDLGLDQISNASKFYYTWRPMLAVHDSTTGFLVPFVQVIGGEEECDVYIDAVEVYNIEANALYPGTLFGVTQ
jgi:hypothetical protein